MGYVLNNQFEISVYFEGNEFPLDKINTLNALVMECTVGLILPTMYLSLTDAGDVLRKNNVIKDGTLVSISVKAPGSSTAKKYSFRIFKYKSQIMMMGTTWHMDGYLDKRKYWLQTTNAGITASSSDLFSQIAQNCGLEYNGESTSDSQLWHPQNKTWGEWVSFVAPYGYASDSSLMVQGVDLKGVLHYKDFNARKDPTVHLGYGVREKGQITVVDYASTVQSGLTNKITGYNNEMRVQSTTRKADVFKEVEIQTEVKEPLVNMDNKSVATRGYQRYGPIDFGNNHDLSEKALYQNARYANLYNLTMEFMCIVATNINIFDNVSFSSNGDENDKSYDGIYRISAKQIKIEGKSYVEFLRGETHGLN